MPSRSNGGSRPKPRGAFSTIGESIKAALALSILPGTGLRRWLLLGAVGGLIFALGIGYLVRFYSDVELPEFLPGPGEAILSIAIAILSLGLASGRLAFLVSDARLASLPDESLRDSILRRRNRERAPRFVAIGGGTGLSTMLRGLKERSRLTGIVTVADDGGSSGRLREELGVLPPGDIRNCIVALADAEPLMQDLFQYRFPAGSALEGHSFGNLFIVAMSGVTGSFEDAIHESSRVLNVAGQIVPSTLDNVRLVAEMKDGTVVEGESAIPLAGGAIQRLRLQPEAPAIYADAREAILDADMVIIGPGSLFTSLIPNLLVPEMVSAIRQRNVPVVYVCNIATQPGETDEYTLADHVRAITDHCPGLRIDYVIANSNFADLQIDYEASHIKLGDLTGLGVRPVETDLIGSPIRTHHDASKLADVLLSIYHESTGNNRFVAPTRRIPADIA